VEVIYKNVTTDDSALAEMLDAAGGVRLVPIIVENGRAIIGFGGT